MECAWFRVPTVVLYKTSPLTYSLGRIFLKVPYLAMPNLLAGEELFPEFLQSEANADNLAEASLRLLRGQGANAPASSTDSSLVAAQARSKAEPPARAAQAVLGTLDFK